MTATETLQARFPKGILHHHAEHGDETVGVAREAAREILRFLRDDSATAFNFLMDLTAVDRLLLEETPRFEVVYHLYSSTQNRRLRVKVGVPERDAEVDSLVELWPIANWFEREVWDMFGIRFEGHPNLKRILLPEEWKGHPLRKDYDIIRQDTEWVRENLGIESGQ